MRCGEEAVVVDLEGLGFAQLVPHAPAPAVAETDEADLEEVIPEQPDEEVMAAIRYTTRLPHDDQIVAVIRELPPNVLQEQLALYKARDMTTAVAERPGKISLNGHGKGRPMRCGLREVVAEAWHEYCELHSIDPERRVRLQTLQVFASEHVEWKSKAKFNPRLIIGWYNKWRMNAAAFWW